MGSDRDGDDADRVGDAPLSDLAREVRERRRGRNGGGERDADADDLFESVETPAVDAESVWETLAAGGDAADAAATRGAGVESDPGDSEASAAGDGERVVPKRAYCQRCPHFSAPPEVACEREGTDVVEVVDADRFRVRDCPVARDAAESDADADAGVDPR